MDKLLGEFDCGYLINLPERTDRLRAARAEIAKVGWEGRVLIWRASKFDSAAGFESIGARGCFHSHFACLKHLMTRPQSGIILEDDNCFTSQLARLEPALSLALQSMPWDIVYFGHEMTGDIERASGKTKSISLRRHSEEIRAMHFYGVHHSIVKRLVEFLEVLLTREPGDPRGGPMTICCSGDQKHNPHDLVGRCNGSRDSVRLGQQLNVRSR